MEKLKIEVVEKQKKQVEFSFPFIADIKGTIMSVFWNLSDSNYYVEILYINTGYYNITVKTNLKLKEVLEIIREQTPGYISGKELFEDDIKLLDMETYDKLKEDLCECIRTSEYKPILYFKNV